MRYWLTVIAFLASVILATAQEVKGQDVPFDEAQTQRKEVTLNPNFITLPSTRVIVYIGYRRPTKPVTPYMQFYRVIVDPRELPDPGVTGRFVDIACFGENDITVRVSRNPEEATFSKYSLNVAVGKDPGDRYWKGGAIAGASFENFERRENLIHLQLTPMKDDLDYQVDARIRDFYFLDEFDGSPWDPDHHVVKDIPCEQQLVYDANG
jgi:hypothetical protein